MIHARFFQSWAIAEEGQRSNAQGLMGPLRGKDCGGPAELIPGYYRLRCMGRAIYIYHLDTATKGAS